MDDSDKAAARLGKEVKASLQRLALFGLIALVDGVVPHLPATGSVCWRVSRRRSGGKVGDAGSLPLNDRA
jgi:hypothetical protein